MADQNTYLRYKRDTKNLIYWIIHASNSILKSPSHGKEEDNETSTLRLNTTGKIKVSQFVPLSKLIVANIKPIPPTIYRLFQSVIGARKATYEAFQQLVTSQPDPEIEKCNASHKSFIDTLTEAFEILGGKIWDSTPKSNGVQKDKEEDFETVIFSNKFAALNINSGDTQVGENVADEDDESEDGTQTTITRPKQKSKGKDKKGKRGKKHKNPKAAVKEPNLDDVPFESYRLIEDEGELITDYLMACYSLSSQWIELRQYVEGLWREVAYSGLNSAAAGTLSNIALAMIKQSESAIFVEFPGHDSYETVMKTLTRGDPDKAQGRFTLERHLVSSDGGVGKSTGVSHALDVKEHFMINIYHDLVDFVTDFQKTRSGKPTKPLLAEISNWDPSFNLQKATMAQRIKWRRSYTINWLYDLVNVFSSIVFQRNTLKGQHWVYEKVDWSVNGPWNQHRRLFGLCEFAGEITTLAMQKPCTDIRNKISPHLVFQLACIVDSFAAFRGWSCNAFRGHVLYPPAKGVRPRRDVDLFLDRENKAFGQGLCQPVDILNELLERDAQLHVQQTRHTQAIEIMIMLRDDFVNWLGESKYMSGLTTIPPSRFSNTNTNGLWEYSPFLCGVGLMEGLELVCAYSFQLWDIIPEPVLLIHLHNMLVQKGYIQPVGLYASLEIIFSTSFFAEGKAPTCDFVKALIAHIDLTGSRRATFERKSMRRHAMRTNTNSHGLMDTQKNRFFKQKSFLSILRDASWVPERIPDSIVPIPSVFACLRIATSKTITNPISGEKVFEDSDFIRRAKASGHDDEALLKAKSLIDSFVNGSVNAIPEELLSQLSAKGIAQVLGKRTHHPSSEYSDDSGTITGRELLDLLKFDIVGDISGFQPLDALNYIWVTCRFMVLFMYIEDKLKELRNPLWVRAYKGGGKMSMEKRVSLALLALNEEDEDEECLRVMANAFEDQRSGFLAHVYWGELGGVKTGDEFGEWKNQGEGYKDPAVTDDDPRCSVM